MKSNFPKSNKIYVVSDIHGGLELLKQHVKLVDSDSYLFILGDLFEKGAKSLETLRYVIKLSKESNVFVIKGNNDQAFLHCLEPENIKYFESRLNRPQSIIYQMVSELKLEGDSFDLQKAIITHYAQEIAWLKNLELYLEVEDFLFVHAGINPQGLAQTDEKTLLGLDNFYELGHYDNHIIVCGHYPTAMYYHNRYDNNILIDLSKRIIDIDGGYGATNLGQLNMLTIIKGRNGYRFEANACDYYPEKKVIRPQKAMGKMRGICFPNYELEIIRPGKYFSLVYVVKTKAICQIKNELIGFKNKRAFALDDCPHNHLGLEVGDKVKVINDQYSGYSLVSHHGICGWVKKDCLQGDD